MQDCGKKLQNIFYYEFDKVSDKSQLFMIAIPLKFEDKHKNMISYTAY